MDSGASEPAEVPSRAVVAERAVVVADLVLRAEFVSKDVPKATAFLVWALCSSAGHSKSRSRRVSYQPAHARNAVLVLALMGKASSDSEH